MSIRTNWSDLKQEMTALSISDWSEIDLKILKAYECGKFNYTKEKYERHEPSIEELTVELRLVDVEMKAAGRYEK